MPGGKKRERMKKLHAASVKSRLEKMLGVARPKTITEASTTLQQDEDDVIPVVVVEDVDNIDCPVSEFSDAAKFSADGAEEPSKNYMCIICTKAFEGPVKLQCRPLRGQKQITEYNSTISSILTQMMKIPVAELEKKYSQHCPLSDKVKICSLCISPAQNILEVIKQIEGLKRKIKNLTKIMKRKVQDSTLILDSNAPEYNNAQEVLHLYREIRQIYLNNWTDCSSPQRISNSASISLIKDQTQLSKKNTAQCASFSELPKKKQCLEDSEVVVPKKKGKLMPMTRNSFADTSPTPKSPKNLTSFTSGADPLSLTNMQPVDSTKLISTAKLGPWFTKLSGNNASLPGSTEKRYPCRICQEVLQSPKEVQQHWKFIHPGFVVCVGPPNLNCQKIFSASEIKRHRQEAHPLFPCTKSGCLESFTSQDKRTKHITENHPEQSLPPYMSMDQTDWVKPISELTAPSLRVVLERREDFGCEIENVLEMDNGGDDDEWDDSMPIILEELDIKDDFSEVVIVPDAQATESASTFSRFDLDSDKTEGPSSGENQNVNPIGLLSEPIDTEFLSKKSISSIALSPFNKNKTETYSKISSQKEHTPTNTSKMQTQCKNDESIPSSNVLETSKQLKKTTLANKVNEERRSISVSKPGSTKDGTVVIPMMNSLVVWYTCSVCQNRFTSKNELLDHFKETHSRNVKFGCYLCPARFNSVDECELHISKAHPRTIRKAYQNPKSENKTALSAPTFGCETCSEIFKDHSDYQKHILKHHPKMLEFKFCCTEDGCTKKFRTETPLLIHKRIVHKIIPVFRCEKCDRIFKHKHVLITHLQVHSGKRYNCKVPGCSTSSSAAVYLKNHMRLKHSKNPPQYLCKVCGKKLATSGALHTHRAIHKDERPYLCSECGKTFKTRNNLYIHMWSHDPDRKQKYSLYYPKAVRDKLRQEREQLAASKLKQQREQLAASNLRKQNGIPIKSQAIKLGPKHSVPKATAVDTSAAPEVSNLQNTDSPDAATRISQPQPIALAPAKTTFDTYEDQRPPEMHLQDLLSL